MGDTPAEHRATLLLVEDEEDIRELIRSILLPLQPIAIIEASTGAEGLRLGISLNRPIDVLLTDMLLPEVSGYDLAAALRQRFPHMRIIMMTGYIEGEIVLRAIEELGAIFIDKPFQAAELRRLIEQAIDVKNVPADR
jgi:DNA-binding NtrC family response regulator